MVAAREIILYGMEQEMAKINKTVGFNIRKYRQKNKLTQEELAFESNLHRAYIGQIERGEKNIGVINLEKIAKALNITIAQLIKNDN